MFIGLGKSNQKIEEKSKIKETGERDYMRSKNKREKLKEEKLKSKRKK